MRFRPNLVVEDAGDGSLKPWSELGWCGRDVRVGPEVVLRINEPTIRCPSTRVRYDRLGDGDARRRSAAFGMPDVALQRAFPSLSAEIFGRETTLAEKGSYLGLYATVIQDSTMSPGTTVLIRGDARRRACRVLRARRVHTSSYHKTHLPTGTHDRRHSLHLER